MYDTSSFAATCVEPGPLTGLSFQRTWPGVTPEAPSNEDRARAFRNAQPVVMANHFEWPFQRPAETWRAAVPVAVGEKPDVSMHGKSAGHPRFRLVQAA